MAAFDLSGKVVIVTGAGSGIGRATAQMVAAQAPPVKTTDISSCWLAVALRAFILYVQFQGKY